jgi:hypothetical protein
VTDVQSLTLARPCLWCFAGSSLVLYAGVGFFGAALFGRSTESNVMLNALTSNPWGGLLLNGCMLFYLAAGAAACQYPLRTSIDMLLVGEHVPMTVARSVSGWRQRGALAAWWLVVMLGTGCAHGVARVSASTLQVQRLLHKLLTTNPCCGSLHAIKAGVCAGLLTPAGVDQCCDLGCVAGGCTGHTWRCGEGVLRCWRNRYVRTEGGQA